MHRYLVWVLSWWPVMGTFAGAGSTMELAATNAIVQVQVSEPLGPESSRHLNIYCKMYPEGPPKLDFIYATYYVSAVTFHNCPPGDDIAVILLAFGVNLDTLEEITLEDIPEAPVLAARHFEGLEGLKKLNLIGANENVTPHSDFLTYLVGLEELNMHRMALAPLPAHNTIQRLHLSHGMSVGPIGACTDLRWLTLENWSVPWNWLGHCPKLVVIKLYETLTFNLIRNVPAAKEIVIRNSKLESLEKTLLQNSRHLVTLKIINSSLEHVESAIFESLGPTLLELDLSHNNLKGEFVTELKWLKALRKLTLSHNDMNNICDHFRNNLTSLTSLKIVNSGLKTLCFDDLLTLNALDLRNNNIKNLDFDKLPLETERSFPLEVHLQGNPIKRISFSKTLFNSLDALRKRENGGALAMIHIDPFCKQDNGYLAQALNMRFVAIDGYSCNKKPSFNFKAIKTVADISAQDGTKLMDDISKFLEDDKNENGEFNISNESNSNNTGDDMSRGIENATPIGFEGVTEDMTRQEERFGTTNGNEYTGSSRRYRCDECYCEGSGTNVRAFCSNLKWFPHITGMRELHAAGNSLSTITFKDLTDNLEIIDLRNNKISRIHEDTLQEIFHLPQRRIFLGGNPIVCDCDNVPMLAELQNYYKQVDFRDLKCNNSNKYIKRLNLEELCIWSPNAGIASTANVVLISVVLVVSLAMTW